MASSTASKNDNADLHVDLPIQKPVILGLKGPYSICLPRSSVSKTRVQKKRKTSDRIGRIADHSRS